MTGSCSGESGLTDTPPVPGSTVPSSSSTSLARLGLELRFIDAALAEKAERRKDQDAADSNKAHPARTPGRFQGMSRDELLRYIVAVGRPVNPKEMQEILASSGINKRIEAVRN